MEVQYISLNMTPTGVDPCFHISQYDVGRTLGFIVHSGGATVDLDTYTCTVEATRSDGTAITSAVATTENTGTFEVTPTMSNKADKYRCQLVIIDANSKRIASLPFDMDVTKAAMDENSESIEEDASLYQQYTEAVQGAIAEANADIQAEEDARIAAVSAEATARADADTTLQNNIDAEATARANAITAEATARQTAGNTLQENINSEASARQAADNTLQSNINAEASTRATQDASLQSQIDQLIAPSGGAPSAAEVQNARVGADGVTYQTLGDAIRTNDSNLKSQIDKVISVASGSASPPSNLLYPLNVSAGDTIKITTGSGALSLWTHSSGSLTNTQYDVEEIGYIRANTTIEFTASAAASYIRVYYGTESSFVAENISKRLPMVESNVAQNASDISDNSNKIDKDSAIITANLMGVDVQQNLYPGAADWSGIWTASNPSSTELSSEKHNGYPVIKLTGSYIKYYKTLDFAVSGRSYTFECWIKAVDASEIRLYIKDTGTATFSSTIRTFTDCEDNTWTKLSGTFVCTGSGTFNPFVTSVNSTTLYIAQYVLVEGDTVFSLLDELADRATLSDITGIGDYKKYEFSHTTIRDYWNPEISMSVPSGTKCKLIFNSFSGNYLSYVRIDGKRSDGTYQNQLAKIDSPKHGAECEFITAENYASFRIQFYSTTAEAAEASVYFTTTKALGIANELLNMQKNRVFHVSKDGAGDFTSFIDAINEATKYMDSVVYVGSGEWNVIDEFGENYMNAVSSDRATWGLVLKNRVHLIGTAKTVIKAVNNSESTNFENIKTYFSVFNAGEKGFTLENINIEDENVRYSVHDDRGGSGSEPYTNRYIRCSMIHKNGKYSDCIGAGLGENQTVEIRGCYFEGDLGRPRLVYWHGNNNSQVTDALGKITVCDNYFAQDGTFMLTKYGQSNTDTVAYVSNNSFGTAPSVNSGSVAPYDNMRIVAWNNEIRS